ncbi:MAG: 3-deoxy-7-phosphoheptulonate synthase [Phycisphaerales bacterium]|nr:3-deoxy-7-phosphoheptulonate synthase [Phycisphaerales bacterium]
MTAMDGNWSPMSWKQHVALQQVVYDDDDAVREAVQRLRMFPPLVTSWGIERLKVLMAEAAEGRRFFLQGGACAEMLSDCRPDIITNKLKILLQMSLVITHGLKKPVIRVGRLAGQYAKPRSCDTETIGDVTLPSYRGDLINRCEFTAQARRPDPHRMIDAYQHAALTLNFIRSLTETGFADLHHPEYWDLAFLKKDHVAQEVREKYEAMATELSEALRFMEALGDRSVEDLSRVDFYCSHEALNLLYESAQTRTVPRRAAYYDLTTHMPWIGDRTRDPNGAHVEFMRGISNPIGIKVGPSIKPSELRELLDILDPDSVPGRITLITRFGADRVEDCLPKLIDVVRSTEHKVVWVCDPMHGNTTQTSTGQKTRNFNEILRELDTCINVHKAKYGYLCGVHFELTGEHVTECIGGASGVSECDLDLQYTTKCDPRLNWEQALEMAFLIAERLGSTPLRNGTL